MSQATFIATDPHRRAESERQLRDLIVEIRGVTEWRISSNGEVTIQYDPEETSSNVVEEALAGIGYQVTHVHDTERLGRADAPNLGVEEEKKRGQKYGGPPKERGDDSPSSTGSRR